MAIYLNWLSESFRKYTNIYPKSKEGQTLLALRFITQVVPNIQKKLQKLEAGPWTLQAALVSEAFKVFNSQDWSEEAKKSKRGKKEKKEEGINIGCNNPGTTSK